MTQEEKQLLLKDLCARLPYGLKVQLIDDPEFSDTPNLCDAWLSLELLQKYGNWGLYKPFVIKPYLRPMSSMTDEEKKHLQLLHNIISDENYGDGYSPCAWDTIAGWVDYCNTHHLDYRGLIKKGLALEAPEDMYGKTKED